MAQAEIWYRARTVEQSGRFGKTPFSTWIHKTLIRSVFQEATYPTLE